ncbi:helix-turn-helix transcriptional regulator [Subsaxibacter sp. CAU 1640]|uniref:response regulator transcription factor n=1 Tax=Subsaxibacter sp. CAU 1640 TaxID=2933271 RepID=UPI002003DE4A|nr:helix-turn-helix transcriptional regulator [Subsaxibacter sp. CAU 1640]MCK7590511.1 helix-turn-helix transcriptional regulator [Subsaxibacter sp. CAU 1640]
MSNSFNQIAEYWRSEYSNNVKKYQEFKAKEQFHQIAQLFSLGHSYYYVMNMHNLEFDYLSPSVKEFTGKEAEDLDIGKLLNMALPQELEYIQLKERIIKDFFLNFLKPEERLNYKIVYPYKMEDHRGNIRTMVLQATTLSLTEDEMIKHVFSVHTDISHLKVTKTDRVSFINLKGGKSYYNLDIHDGVFRSSSADSMTPDTLYSDREKDIITALAKGQNTEETAEFLNISKHTVKTHRRNILSKSGYTNTAELIAQCVLNDVITLE